MNNAYMQSNTFNVIPKEGMLVAFLSWRLHKAMPYGEKDRIIISFNAQIHGEGGNKSPEYGFD